MPKKKIEEINDDDLLALWPVIGGEPHLFEYGKQELKQVLVDGDCSTTTEICGEIVESAIGLQLDFYTMAAIVDILRDRGFKTPDYVRISKGDLRDEL